MPISAKEKAKVKEKVESMGLADARILKTNKAMSCDADCASPMNTLRPDALQGARECRHLSSTTAAREAAPTDGRNTD